MITLNGQALYISSRTGEFTPEGRAAVTFRQAFISPVDGDGEPVKITLYRDCPDFGNIKPGTVLNLTVSLEASQKGLRSRLLDFEVVK